MKNRPPTDDEARINMFYLVLIGIGIIAILNLLGWAPDDLRFDYSDLPRK